MKPSIFKLSLLASTLATVGWVVIPLMAEEATPTTEAVITQESSEPAVASTFDESTMEKAKEPVAPVESERPVKAKATSKRTDRANAFLAGADWSFDGFVAGGQESQIRSMFYLNDLVYLNIGSEQGISIGDKIGIYKRGERFNDPQTGKFIGYEVRLAAIGRVTDRIDEGTSSVRIRDTYEQVEVGDLIRKEK